jgi:autotransporter-associated beta strand protein
VFLQIRPKYFRFFGIIVLISGYFSAHANVGTTTIKWGTKMGTDAPHHFNTLTDTNSSALSNYLLMYLDGTATSGVADVVVLPDGTDDSISLDSALVELGFFDTDGVNDSSYTPNSSDIGTDLFKGLWTPLTSKTSIGQDWYVSGYSVPGSTDVGAGLFFFETVFNEGSASLDGNASSNLDYSYPIYNDLPTGLEQRVEALNDASNNAYIGIRFYDTNAGPGVSNSTSSRYNTIMNPSWKWVSSTESKFLLTDSGLEFEFDNTDAYTAYNSRVENAAGTVGDYRVPNNDFVATISYFDGNGTFAAGGESHIFSGLNSVNSSAKITAGGNVSERTITLHSNEGNSFLFEGDIEGSTADTNANTTIVKTGSGKQTLSGDVRLAGSDSGWLNVSDGTLSLAGSNKTYTFEYLTGSGGTLELNTTSSTTDIELGFANTSSSQSYDGNISMVAGQDITIKVASGSAVTDYNKTQNITGIISGSDKLIKSGLGRLVLDANNTNSGGVEITDGTLVAGESSALGSANDITITKGKFEVADGVTLSNANTPTITAGNSNKTMIGGRGDLNNDITVGSGNGQIDVISPGDGISSSLTSSASMQQVSLGDRANAIGTFTVDELTLASGGVYDWEISDFNGTAGQDWDLIMYDSLVYNVGDSFTINILGLEANGSAGPMAGGNVWQNYTSNGFLFMDSVSGSHAWTGTSAAASSAYMDDFVVNTDGWSYHNDHWLHDWNVWYDGSGGFYLQYSVAPEPSTYVMVTGLMLVPGMNAVRKYRNRKKKQGLEEPEEEIRS